MIISYVTLVRYNNIITAVLPRILILSQIRFSYFLSDTTRLMLNLCFNFDNDLMRFTKTPRRISRLGKDISLPKFHPNIRFKPKINHSAYNNPLLRHRQRKIPLPGSPCMVLIRLRFPLT